MGQHCERRRGFTLRLLGDDMVRLLTKLSGMRCRAQRADVTSCPRARGAERAQTLVFVCQQRGAIHEEMSTGTSVTGVMHCRWPGTRGLHPHELPAECSLPRSETHKPTFGCGDHEINRAWCPLLVAGRQRAALLPCIPSSTSVLAGLLSM